MSATATESPLGHNVDPLSKAPLADEFSMVQLPFDVLPLIFDQLGDEIRALASLLVVSRAVHDVVSPLLYSCCPMRGATEPMQPLGLIAEASRNYPNLMRRITSLNFNVEWYLRNAAGSSEVDATEALSRLTSVRTINLSADGQLADQSGSPSSRDRRKSLINLVVALAALPHLKHVRVYSFPRDQLPYDEVPILQLSSLRIVDCLLLIRCRGLLPWLHKCGERAERFDVEANFTRDEDISLALFTMTGLRAHGPPQFCTMNPVREGVVLGPAKRLTHLSFGYVHTESVTFHLPELPALEKLSIHHDPDLRSRARFDRLFGCILAVTRHTTKLRSLHVHGGNSGMHIRKAFLDPFTQKHSLTLREFMLPFCSIRPDAVELLARCNGLQVLAYDASGPRDIAQLQAHELMLQRWPFLQAVQIRLPATVRSQAVADGILASLPVLREVRLLAASMRATPNVLCSRKTWVWDGSSAVELIERWDIARFRSCEDSIEDDGTVPLSSFW